MNIFYQGLNYLFLSVLMIANFILSIFGGIFYYATKTILTARLAIKKMIEKIETDFRCKTMNKPTFKKR